MKINYIDNYDSFANTIAAYFRMAGADVAHLKSNCSLETAVKGSPDLILLGPGPNGPRNAGNYMELLDKYYRKLPFFGICLGFQAMMEYFGQSVQRLGDVRQADVLHGAAVRVSHDGKGIFEGISPDAEFARYNSLGVYTVPDCFEIAGTQNDGTGLVMAARHKVLPIEGVQFHPESILSSHDDAGIRIVKNVVKRYTK